MTIVSTVMIVLATVHIALNLHRVLEGYTTPGVDPIEYYAQLNLWSHVTKDTIYATQEIVGNGAAVSFSFESFLYSIIRNLLFLMRWVDCLLPGVSRVGAVES